jgi:hypothetical protein
MKPEEIFEQVSLFLPKYLTPSQKQDLYSEMLRFPGTTQFYLHRPGVLYDFCCDYLKACTEYPLASIRVSR